MIFLCDGSCLGGTVQFYIFTVIEQFTISTLQNKMLSSLSRTIRRCAQRPGIRCLATNGFPPPRLFNYDTVTSHLTVADAISSVEEAFAALARDTVDVPMPMHIGINESSVAGPGDCHIKGGYIDGTPTFTVKLACVSFYKNAERDYLLEVESSLLSMP
jgi:hypothetical protein